MLRGFPSTGSRRLDWAIVLFGFFLFVMKVISGFREKDPYGRENLERSPQTRLRKIHSPTVTSDLAPTIAVARSWSRP